MVFDVVMSMWLMRGCARSEGGGAGGGGGGLTGSRENVAGIVFVSHHATSATRHVKLKYLIV